MRRAEKKKVLDFTDSLHQAHGEIRGALERKNRITAGQMLGECQKFAIKLGEYIEEWEGDTHPTVAYAEAYCEALFCAYEEVGGGKDNPYKVCRPIDRMLVKLENSIKNDIAARKEVVFFPYKASMWDSLESVYLAAREDPNCDAHCVPIPYYDRNPNGSFGQMHYEGEAYPPNIEITDWRDYRFEERCPDQIYIHNPYDSWNRVTSVHPRFYADNLKKYTQQLIYIPYFLLGEIEPEDQAAIDGMKHFVYLPGTVYADKVIVQSEKMKQVYVNEYLKAAKENGLTGIHLDRRYLEQKFLGLGSPKVDRIENALKVFKEEQEEAVLLWRPHPLLENTLGSMRAGLLKRYQDLKKQFIREGWGIYDDTVELDRAIALSDAYYGDGSSVAQLFRAVGKPVLIQNVEVLTGR